MTKLIQSMSDGLLSVFAPKVRASAACPACHLVGQCGACNGNRRYRTRVCYSGPGCQYETTTCVAVASCAP
jgi:hypothetical protein